MDGKWHSSVPPRRYFWFAHGVPRSWMPASPRYSLNAGEESLSCLILPTLETVLIPSPTTQTTCRRKCHPLPRLVPVLYPRPLAALLPQKKDRTCHARTRTHDWCRRALTSLPHVGQSASRKLATDTVSSSCRTLWWPARDMEVRLPYRRALSSQVHLRTITPTAVLYRHHCCPGLGRVKRVRLLLFHEQRDPSVTTDARNSARNRLRSDMWQVYILSAGRAKARRRHP